MTICGQAQNFVNHSAFVCDGDGPGRKESAYDVIKLVGAPVLYCWRASAERVGELPYPKAMRVVITAGASALSYFLLYALIKGVVSFF